MFEQGYKAFFDRVSYNKNTNPEWLNGWTRAERESRCGWYDIQGKPSDFNKAVR